MVKYPDLTLGTIEAMVNKLGGAARVKDFLGGNLVLAFPKPLPGIIDLDRSQHIFSSPWIRKDLVLVPELQDRRSLAITELDLAKISFKKPLNDGNWFRPNEREKELEKANNVLAWLDAKVFCVLLDNQKLIPEFWRYKSPGGYETRYIMFEGTIFRYPQGGWYVLAMYWGGHKRGWVGFQTSLCHGYQGYYCSATIATSEV